MDKWSCRTGFTILIAIYVTIASSTKDLNDIKSECKNGAAVYNVTFTTFWSEVTFPKQYPHFRPNAQWSQLVGRTHNEQFMLFRLDELSSTGIRELAELASAEELGKQTQGKQGVFDVFRTDNIPVGVGNTWTTFIVDGDHSKFSAVSKVIPSPDWFVGIDSLDLCPSGQWLSNTQQNLRIFDAGTDKGFTFSAPNWEDRPPQPITEITSFDPSHPANSFFYPEFNSLPTIATLTLNKLRDLSQATPCGHTAEPVFSAGSNQHQSELVATVQPGIITDRETLHNDRQKLDDLETAVQDPIISEPVVKEPIIPEPAIQVPIIPESGVQEQIRPEPAVQEPTRPEPARLELYMQEQVRQEPARDVVIMQERNPAHKATLSARTRAPQFMDHTDGKVQHSNTDTAVIDDIPWFGLMHDNREPEQVRVPQAVESVQPHVTERTTLAGADDLPYRQQATTDAASVATTVQTRGPRKRTRRVQHRKHSVKPTHTQRRHRVTESPGATEPQPHGYLEEPTAPAAVNCETGWSPWTECSKTCGYGTQHRSFIVLVEPENGGKPCAHYAPVSDQIQLCGSMRSCEWVHFSFSNWGHK